LQRHAAVADDVFVGQRANCILLLTTLAAETSQRRAPALSRSLRRRSRLSSPTTPTSHRACSATSTITTLPPSHVAQARFYYAPKLQLSRSLPIDDAALRSAFPDDDESITHGVRRPGIACKLSFVTLTPRLPRPCQRPQLARRSHPSTPRPPTTIRRNVPAEDDLDSPRRQHRFQARDIENQRKDPWNVRNGTYEAEGTGSKQCEAAHTVCRCSLRRSAGNADDA
jgi:hypothetical protein